MIGVTVSVTEDGVERALTGAGVTRGAGARDAAHALLRVSGGPGRVGERGGLGVVVVAGPEGMGHGAVE